MCCCPLLSSSAFSVSANISAFLTITTFKMLLNTPEYAPSKIATELLFSHRNDAQLVLTGNQVPVNSTHSKPTLFNRDVQGLTRIQELRRWSSEHGTKYADVAMEGALAVGLVLSGRVSDGIKFLESAIAARDADGFRSMAAWNRVTLAEIYLEILTARERPPMRIIVKNLWTFLASMLFGARRAEELLEKAAAHEQLHVRARINMDLGLLYKLKRQPGADLP